MTLTDTSKTELRTNHPVYGISAPEKGWVPAPRYLMRRERILKILDPFPRGNLLEIGCGAGALLKDLSIRGFACSALETSNDALELARYINKDDPNVKLYHQPQDTWRLKFDYILAFEVLEHIRDDADTLKLWINWLKKDGRILISVPANPSKWNSTDVWAGHFRRYDRIGLMRLMENAGLSLEHFECYGFPLCNAIEPIRSHYHKKQLQRQAADVNEVGQHTRRSGVERTLETKLYPIQASWIGTKIMQLFFTLQDLFRTTDLGNGYLVLGRKL